MSHRETKLQGIKVVYITELTLIIIIRFLINFLKVPDCLCSNQNQFSNLKADFFNACNDGVTDTSFP